MRSASRSPRLGASGHGAPRHGAPCSRTRDSRTRGSRARDSRTPHSWARRDLPAFPSPCAGPGAPAPDSLRPVSARPHFGAPPFQGAHVTATAGVKLKTAELQKAAESRYQYWWYRTDPTPTAPFTEIGTPLGGVVPVG